MESGARKSNSYINLIYLMIYIYIEIFMLTQCENLEANYDAINYW